MSNDSSAIVRPSDADYARSGAAIQKVGFEASEIANVRETQAVAAAEHAKALVQARYLMAERHPRDLDDFRVRLLKHCKRPGFAKLAEYAKPVGGQRVRGPSIRFVETALQEYGNVNPEAVAVYDDDEKRILRVTVTDLERNITYAEDTTVEKFVERRSADGEVVGERRKKNGEVVFKVRATEDDFANKQAAAVSKKVRGLGLRILPADIVAEAMDACTRTRADEDARDPDAARRALADAFAGIGVSPADLAAYLGHDLATCSPSEVDDLRRVFVAIRDGEGTWQAALTIAREQRGEIEKAANPAADKLKASLAAAAEKDKARAAKKKEG